MEERGGEGGEGGEWGGVERRGEERREKASCQEGQSYMVPVCLEWTNRSDAPGLALLCGSQLTQCSHFKILPAIMI